MTEIINKTREISRLLEEARTGDKAAISKLITVLEGDGDPVFDLLEKSEQTGRKAYVIGIAGAPGAGKSTIISRLPARLAPEKKLAILCVDPSSIIGGGAILGDRIRIQDSIDQNPAIFMRSFSSRYSMGGLSTSVFLAAKVLAFGGYESVLIEGVGAGQLDVKPLLFAHTRIVVLTPASGDLIQSIKSGIMEMGDIYVINQADQPGAELMKMNVQQAVRMGTLGGEWVPPVLTTIAKDDTGIDELVSAIRAHERYLRQGSEWTKREETMRLTELKELMLARFIRLTETILSSDAQSKAIVIRYMKGELSTRVALRSILERAKEMIPDVG